jgi:hypothetical protein
MRIVLPTRAKGWACDSSWRWTGPMAEVRPAMTRISVRKRPTDASDGSSREGCHGRVERPAGSDAASHRRWDGFTGKRRTRRQVLGGAGAFGVGGVLTAAG